MQEFNSYQSKNIIFRVFMEKIVLIPTDIHIGIDTNVLPKQY